MPSKELIEKVAKALARNFNSYHFDRGDSEAGWEEHIDAANIAIAAIHDALQEPTDTMLQAYWDGSEASDSWGLMLNASALGEQSE